MNTDVIEVFEADAELLKKATHCDHGIALIKDCYLCEMIPYWQERSELFTND